jgi:hypothetical protein
MAKAIQPKKERADKYEEKVTFNGTFEDMIKISTTGAEAKKAGATSAGEKKGERSK